MKLKVFILLIPLLLGYSCKLHLKKDLEDFANGVRVQKEYFSNGNVKTEITIQNNLPHGLTRNFDREGLLLSEANYHQGVLDGVAKNYYPKSGKLSSSFTYVKGLKEGDEIWFYESGKPYRISPFVHDKIEGVQKKYYENGKLLSEVPFKNDRPGKGLKEYYSDGRLFTDYPTIVFKTEDHLATTNIIILVIKLSNNSPDVKFYKGNLSGGTYLPDTLIGLNTKNGIAKISFTVPPGAMIRRVITVCARYTTLNGNPYIMEKSYTLSAISPN